MTLLGPIRLPAASLLIWMPWPPLPADGGRALIQGQRVGEHDRLAGEARVEGDDQRLP